MFALKTKKKNDRRWTIKFGDAHRNFYDMAESGESDWHFYCVTYTINAQTWRFYMDGSLEDQGALGLTTTINYALTLGRHRSGDGRRGTRPGRPSRNPVERARSSRPVL